MSDPEMDAIIAKHAPPRFRWLRLIGRTVVIVVLLLILLAGAFELLEAPFRLVLGWLFHLRNVLPALSWSLESILCSLGALLLGVVGLHLLMPKLTGRAWPLRWSVAWCGLLTLLFATSVAAVGIVHQTGWLFRAPWFETKFFSAMRSVNNARQVILSCHQYAAKHHESFPSGLHELGTEKIVADTRIYFGHPDRKMPEEAWVYLAAGLKATDNPALPVLLSPSTSPAHQRIIGRLDGSTELVDEAEVEKALKLLQQHWNAGDTSAP
ncbi:MAG: hypothetical protein U1F81_12475 [Verrucomicrobiaceae bacterium]